MAFCEKIREASRKLHCADREVLESALFQLQGDHTLFDQARHHAGAVRVPKAGVAGVGAGTVRFRRRLMTFSQRAKEEVGRKPRASSAVCWGYLPV